MPALDSSSVMDLQGSLPIHTGDVHSVAVTNDYIVTTSGDKIVRVFNRQNLTEKSYSPLQIHKYHVISCRITKAGDRLLCASMDGKASVVDLTTGKLVSLYNHPGDVGMRTCAIAENDQLMAVGAVDGSITIIEMDTYKPLKTMSMNDDESILSLAFTPDSHWLISGHSVTGDLRVWNAVYLNKKYAGFIMMAHELGTHCINMSPTNYTDPESARTCYRFVSSGEDSMVCIWQISYQEHDQNPKLEKISTLVGHTAPVYCARFSADGDSIVSCSGDLTVRLWNLDGECVYVHVDAHKSFVNSCSFSPDMKLIYTASTDRTVKVWRLTDTYSLKAASPVSLVVVTPVNDSDNQQHDVTSATNQRTKSRSNTMNVAAWTVDDVCFWLGQLGLSKYADIFQRNEMDGNELMRINHDILERELKISAFGARNKIIHGLEELFVSRSVTENEPNEDSTDLPNEFLCPITHNVMVDPVVASDGYSYERKAIESWFTAGKTSSPMTNAQLPNQSLISNHTLRALIHRQSQQ